MSILDDKEVLEAIFTETEEMINNIEKEITEYEKDFGNPEHIRRLFRFIHTIKGNAGMLGDRGDMLAKIAHKTEDLLGMIRDGKIAFQKEAIPFFYEVHTTIKDIFNRLKADEKVTPDMLQIEQKIEEIIKNGKFKRRESIKRDLVAEISKEFKAEENIRVDLRRVDELVNLLGELYLNTKRYTYQFYQLKERGDFTELDIMEDAVLKINYLLDEFREKLLNIRMVKFGLLFNRFPSMVRQMALSLNKKIELKIETKGEQIDKRILDEVAEPILHIIRNCVDHGIEMPDIRVKQGKKQTGTISIRTYYQAGNIAIEIEDDGAGIDIEKIKRKLKKMQLYSENEINFMSEKDLINAIFLPGFSTKEQSTDISGRGVGMDIVADKIKRLKGEIEVESVKGKGTLFRIVLPLTLSIVEVFSVILNSNEFLFFKDDVKFLLKITDEQIKRVGDRDVVDYGDNIIPVYQLAEYLFPDNHSGDNNRIFKSVVVIGRGEELYGMIVDKFIGLKRIVLKEFEHMKMLSIFDGATISEDGRIALVLNSSTLLEKLRKSRT